MVPLKTLLISEKNIKDSSIIDSNVDSKTLSNIIWNVQETQLKAALGKELYNSLLAIVYNFQMHDEVMSEQSTELLNDYVAPYLTYATLIDFIVINNYKLNNKGLMKLNDNSATSASAAEIEYAKNYYDNYLSVYKNNLIEYLKSESLIEGSTDLNVSSQAIGWYLEGVKGCGVTVNASTPVDYVATNLNASFNYIFPITLD